MGLYNFQPRFVPFILSGHKRHTIRAIRRYPDKPGDILHLYTGLRQKNAQLLMRVPCLKVEEIEIHITPGNGRLIRIEGISLDHTESDALARRDGFKDFRDMMAFWDGRLPFKGHIIHWKYLKTPDLES